MDDIKTLADREFNELCAKADIEPSETLRRTFRLGFMAGALHQIEKTVSQIQAQAEAA